jgi:hypothetical protein
VADNQGSPTGCREPSAVVSTLRNVTAYHAWLVQRLDRAGDGDNPARIRDHGSRASHKLGTGRGFGTASSASRNTFAASATKVS